MKSRKELKEIGKMSMKANYWNCVLVVLLMTAIFSVLSWLSGGEQLMATVQSGMQMAADGSAETPTYMTVSAGSGAGGLLSFLISGPLSIGMCFFFVKNLHDENRGDLSVVTPFKEAFNNFPRKLGGSLWMGLFVFLWSLLFVIPGIIKSYSYSMTEYILADCPNVKAQDALKLSMRMMKGHKWEFFVLQLSFLGWVLLTILTLGILGIFYVDPYRNSTYAAYYESVRDQAILYGAVTKDELNGAPLQAE